MLNLVYVANESELGRRFLAALPPKLQQHYSEGEVQRLLAAASTSALARFGAMSDLDANYAAFVAARVAEESTDEPVTLDSLFLEDLYLSCQCSVGSSEAITILESTYFRSLDSLRSRSGVGLDRGDFWQHMSERLLVGSPPKIATYRGRGPLGRWLRVSVTRALIDLGRARGQREIVDDQDLVGNMADLVDGPEMALIKSQHNTDIRSLFQESIGGLTPRQRNLFRLRYIRGLSMDEIARIHGLHRVSASRALSTARAALRQKLREGLRESGLEPSAALEETLALIDSQIDLSLERLLA